VELADNGGAREDVGSPMLTRGVGLQNMEERCALAYGRCFFSSDPEGFRVVMTFPMKGLVQ
jgi:signal transduction histidine kinase